MNYKLKSKIVEHYGQQWRFAKDMKIDESFVSRIITGARDLPKDKQTVWAKKLSCKATDIFPAE